MLADGGVGGLKEGVARFLGNDDFDELNRIKHIRGQTGKGKRSLTRPSLRRESIASDLKRGRPCLLIEVTDEATATLIAHDPGAAKYCLPAGERHLGVPTKNERGFRTAVKKLGYILPR